MNVYIAGPMTGHDRYNEAAFLAARDALKHRGHNVITPFDLNDMVWFRNTGRHFDPGTDKCDWDTPEHATILREMLTEDMVAVLAADAVYVLPGWQRSRGATVEVLVAQNANIPVIEYATGGPVTQRVVANLSEGTRAAA